jgi:hypothetical protein
MIPNKTEVSLHVGGGHGQKGWFFINAGLGRLTENEHRTPACHASQTMGV